MSYLLFLDESGIDQRDSPYEVLAGVAVQDQHLWNLICRIEEAEIEHFGRRVTSGALELKGKSLLKRKTFRLAAQLPPIAAGERHRLGHPIRSDERASSGRVGLCGGVGLRVALSNQARGSAGPSGLELYAHRRSPTARRKGKIVKKKKGNAGYPAKPPEKE